MIIFVTSNISRLLRVTNWKSFHNVRSRVVPFFDIVNNRLMWKKSQIWNFYWKQISFVKDDHRICDNRGIVNCGNFHLSVLFIIFHLSTGSQLWGQLQQSPTNQQTLWIIIWIVDWRQYQHTDLYQVLTSHQYMIECAL